jgi:2-succinyl-5-enolpyruvyl-6-hydroxy-3-cyclohexene-1-carboxylate synthase
MPSPFETASAVVQSLYQNGVRHAVISPGSRSTPLTLAFAYHPGISKKIVLDERSAAFIALGIGKVSGRPAALVCTSGTAAANYFPAIAEAKQAGVPMIVLTADRPPNLRGTGSSQTIDQVKLYGDYAVFFHEMGEPGIDERDTARIRYAAKQAVTDSIRKGGAAHLNFPFRKPLEPSKEIADLARERFERQPDDTKPVRSAFSRTLRLDEELSDLINKSSRPLIIAGPANKHQSNSSTAAKLAEKLNAPIIAEPGSRFDHHPLRVHRYEQLLRNDSARNSLAPDILLRFGDQPFTKSVLGGMEAWKDLPTIQFSGRLSWQDHHMSSDWNIELHQNDRFDLNSLESKGSDYFVQWKNADSDAEKRLNDTLKNEDGLCDGHVFHHITKKIPAEWNLMLSNSLPVRDAALFGNPGPGVNVNRGAAGIDGILSTAIGTAMATKSPVACVLGDLAFLHDANALLSLKNIGTPFSVIVINNNGGNIFRMLPIYEHGEIYQSYFETPQDADIEHIARAYGISYMRIVSKKELGQVSFNRTENKPVLFECITNPDKSMIMRKKLWGGQ